MLAAVDVSGRPFLVWEVELPIEIIGTFDTTLAEEFMRAFATNAGVTLHVRSLSGDERAPHRRGGVQGGRPRAGPGRVALDPRVTGVPSTKGVAVIAIVDYRMGNLRSVQKGFEAAGVHDVVVTDDPAVIGAADGIVLPGVGAFRDASANLAASGHGRTARASAPRPGVPLLGICLGMQLLVTHGSRGRHVGGPRPRARRVRPAARRASRSRTWAGTP